MADSTLWWIITGVLVALELATGTFYLLMLAIGSIAGALAAHGGFGTQAQMAVAAGVGASVIAACNEAQQPKARRRGASYSDLRTALCATQLWTDRSSKSDRLTVRRQRL